MKGLREMLDDMAHSPLRNYATPGLTSYLIGGETRETRGGELVVEKFGKVRMFSSDRDTRDWIAPHTHRYDFLCYVVKGEVENIIFDEQSFTSENSNKFTVCRIEPGAQIGTYDVQHVTIGNFIEIPQTYSAGETYAMKSNEYHSIRFSKGAQVLFFEGPEELPYSYMLQPYSNGGTVETFASSAWMFRRD